MGDGLNDLLPQKDHDALKKPDVSPSGPSALLGFNRNIILVISSVDGIEAIEGSTSVGHTKPIVS